MSDYEQTIKRLIETTPAWEKDGGGIRGRTIAPLIGGASTSGIAQELESQQFNSNKNQFSLRGPTTSDELFLSSPSGGGEVPPHPWQVLLRTVPDTDPPVYEYKIDVNSTLYRGLGSFDNITVTGRDSWDEASVGYLYLFGTVEDGVCTEASIQGPEEIPSDRIDFVDNKQNSFSVIIAYLYNDGNGGIAVQQRAFHDFTIIDSCVNGKPAIYPIAT